MRKTDRVPDNPPILREQRRRGLPASFAAAFAGIAFALRTQRNVRIHLAAAALALLLGVAAGLGATEWAVLVLTIAAVWTAELINTALEAAVDLISPARQDLARVAKDVSAAAVLVAAVAAVAVGALVLVPRLSGGPAHDEALPDARPAARLPGPWGQVVDRDSRGLSASSRQA